MISKERVREIVRDVLVEHMHGEWSDIAQDYVFSKWDKELLEINKEINTKVRDEGVSISLDTNTAVEAFERASEVEE